MPMSPRLLRPIASGVHPDANDWRSRVVANGGSVSASTMKAVSKFCGDINAAGIRDRFFRLNLFCGNSDASLNAVRTPLFRGPSRTGTQHGNALDTNNNFVAGDYAETGSGAGLDGNGTSKYLDTGLPVDFPRTDGGDIHLGAYQTVLPVTGAFQRMIGVTDTVAPATFHALIARPDQSPQLFAYFAGGNSTTFQGPLTLGHTVGCDAVTKRIFVNGLPSSIGSQGVGSVTINSSSRPFFVFADNSNGSAASYNNGVMAAYHIGRSISNAQVASLFTILQAFQTALGRNV